MAIWDWNDAMLKGERFGPHSEKHGHRLGKQIGLGGTSLQRRFVDASAEPVSGAAVTSAAVGVADLAEFGRRAKAAQEAVNALGAGVSANSNEPRRVGRPRAEGVRPWEALGLSRSEYFRRKARGVVG